MTLFRRSEVMPLWHNGAYKDIAERHNQPRRFALIPATRAGPRATHTMVFVFRGLCTLHDGQGQLCFPKRVCNAVRD